MVAKKRMPAFRHMAASDKQWAIGQVEAGRSLSDVARQLGCNSSSVASWMKGKYLNSPPNAVPRIPVAANANVAASANNLPLQQAALKASQRLARAEKRINEAVSNVDELIGLMSKLVERVAEIEKGIVVIAEKVAGEAKPKRNGLLGRIDAAMSER